MDSVKNQIATADTIGNIAPSISGLSSGVYSVQPSVYMGAIGAGGYSYSDTTNLSTVTMATGRLSLNGTNADIVINGVSLISKIEAIGQRLNILDVNPELEAEWDQLRELGERYRQLEQELQDKADMWKTLKTKQSNKLRG